jgi:NAD(P)-dependent dehydrogenase (short-subunit alcohol dehydrogenase family)
MGATLATQLIALGWKVACVDIQYAPGMALAASLGPNAQFFQADVASYTSQAEMFTAVWKYWGRIDALCANAGIADRSSLYILSHRNSPSVPPEPDLYCTDVDYKGIVYGTQLAIHFMRKNAVPGGKIVCTASIAGLFPFEIIPEYCGAKAAVVGFVRAMAPVLKVKEGITINAVCPGVVDTPIIPPEMIKAVSREWRVLLSRITQMWSSIC